MKKTICAIIAIGCAIGFIGAAGSSDLGTMSALQAFKVSAITVPGLALSLRIGGFIK